MSFKIIEFNGLTWYFFNKVEDDDLQFLRSQFRFHPLTLKDVVSTQENPKIDVFNNYIFSVFHFAEMKKNIRKLVTHELDVYMGPDYIITIQETNFRLHRDLFFKVANNISMRKDFFSDGIDFLFYKIIHTLFTNSCEPIVKYLARNIKFLEDNIYEHEELKKSLIEASILRRNVLNFKSVIEPQIKLIHTLSSMDNKIVKGKYGQYYDDIDDYIERIWVILNNQTEIISGLNDTAESLISFKTNEVVKLLTIISVAMLPLTLFTGIYGMNIPLPYAHNPFVVWSLFVALAVFVVIVLFAFLKRNK